MSVAYCRVTYRQTTISSHSFRIFRVTNQPFLHSGRKPDYTERRLDSTLLSHGQGKITTSNQRRTSSDYRPHRHGGESANSTQKGTTFGNWETCDLLWKDSASHCITTLSMWRNHWYCCPTHKLCKEWLTWGDLCWKRKVHKGRQRHQEQQPEPAAWYTSPATDSTVPPSLQNMTCGQKMHRQTVCD